MDKKELAAFMKDFYDAWTKRDDEKIASFYHPELKAYSDFSEISMEDILNRLEFSKEKFEKVNYIMEDQFIDEEQGKIACRMKQRHILKTGDLVKWEAIMLYKIQDRKIKELWMSFYPNADYLNNDQF